MIHKKAGKESLLNEETIKRTKKESILIEQGRVLLLSKWKSRLKNLNVNFEYPEGGVRSYVVVTYKGK